MNSRDKEPQAHEGLAGTDQMEQRIRAYDWSKTPLGPLESWPQSLKTVLTMALNSPESQVVRISEERYRKLYESIDEGFCIIRVVFDDNGKAVDFVFLEVNPSFEKQTGVTDALGRSMRGIAPQHEEHWFEMYGQIALTGQSRRFEYPAVQLQRWYEGYAYRVGDPDEGKVATIFNDITERKQAEEALAADLEDTQRLREVASLLSSSTDIQTVYEEILDAAITFMRADAGTVQILDETTQELVLLTARGFDLDMTQHFYRVNAGSLTSCGIAFSKGERSFVDFDAPGVADPDGALRLHLDAGYRSAQSTPLVTRSGKRIGMLSTHWREHRRPNERDLRFLDLLTRQAADLIERELTEAHLQAELADTKLLQSVSAEILRQDDPHMLYEKIVDGAMTIMRSDYVSLQMFYPERGAGGELRLLAYRGFNAEAKKFWEWVGIDSAGTTCGRALRSGRRVIVDDVEQCEFMEGTQDLAVFLQTGIRSCQTTPLFARDGTLVGMISTHWCVPHRSSDRDLRLLDILARQTADFIERQQAEGSLRKSEERLRLLAETAEVLLRSESPQTVVNALCRRVMDFIDCDAFFNYLIHPSAGRLRLNACAGIPEDEVRRIEWLNLVENLSDRAALEGNRIVVEHLGETGDLRTELVRSYGIQAYACHPLFAQGKVLGTLSFGTRTRASFSEDDLALMKAVADQVAIAMQRKQGEAALRESERHLDLVSNAVPALISYVGTDLRYRSCNRGYTTWFGVSRGEIIGKTMREVLGEDVWTMIAPHIEKALSGQVVVYEAELTYRVGGTKWIQAIYTPHYNDMRHVVGIIIMVMDVTARKRQEEELARRSHQQSLMYELADVVNRAEVLSDLFEKALDVIIASVNADRASILLFDDKGILRFKAWRGLSDEYRSKVEGHSPWTKDECDPKPLSIGDVSGAAIEPALKAVLQQEGIQALGFVPFTYAGRLLGEFKVYFNRPHVMNEEELNLMQAIAGTLALGIERKNAEVHLRESKERLRAFADQLEQLVEERTHELVQSRDHLRALATELNVAEQRERKRIAAELHDYLAQVLVLARLKLGQMKGVAGIDSKLLPFISQAENAISEGLAYTRTLVADLCPPVLHDFGLPAALRWLGEHMDRHKLKVTVHAEEIAVAIPEDQAVLLFQSVRELLINTAKHSGVEEAMLSLVQQDGQLRVEVRDHGKGFAVGSPQLMKFGLFSIRERMRALGGAFEIQSTPGTGTIAVLILPLRTTAAEPDRRAFKRPVGKSSVIPDQAAPTVRQSVTHQQATIAVLLVDDHAMVRQGLRSVLEGYPDIQVVGEAANGEEAIEQVIKYKPDIVLMDINMPKLNGVEATGRIKSLYPDSIVIGLSVQRGGQVQQALLAAGATMLLTKEAAVDELYQAILNALKRRQDGLLSEALPS
jgi:PAS domain S-box-containing protein